MALSVVEFTDIELVIVVAPEIYHPLFVSWMKSEITVEAVEKLHYVAGY